MRVSIVGGTGNQGKGLALRLGKVGYSIFLGSRSKQKAIDTAYEIKEKHPDIKIEGLDNIEAADMGEVIILTVPYKSIGEIINEIRDQLKGKVVIDTTVALVPGRPPRTERMQEGSVAQKIQQLVGEETKVVSAFHTVSAHLLQNIEQPLGGDTLIAGDHLQAKEMAMALVGKIGLRPLDAGPLQASSTLEDLTALLIGMNIRYKKKSIGIHFTNL